MQSVRARPVTRSFAGETSAQRKANARRTAAARRRGDVYVWVEGMVDVDGELVPHRRLLNVVEAEARYADLLGEPTWTQATIDDAGRTRVRERGVWRSWRPAVRVRGRAPRAATNGRSRGSRRVASRSSGGGDPDSDESDPEGVREHHVGEGSSGRRYGGWTIIAEVPQRSKAGYRRYLCRHDDGTESVEHEVGLALAAHMASRSAGRS